MQFKPNKSWWLLGVGVLFGASAAYAASDPRYVTASEGIDRSVTFLTAIGTGVEKPGAAFQRKRALKALERAKLRIACAKEIEDSTTKKRGCPAAMKERFDDSDDDKDDHDDHGHKDKAEKEQKEKAEKEKAEKQKAELEKQKAEAKKKAEEKKKAEKK